MKKIAVTVCFFAVIAMVATFALSQPPRGQDGEGRGPGGPGGRGPDGRRGPPPNPIAEALDANRDHVISADEIKNASKALKKLDRNGDGKLTHDELRPFGPPPGGPRPDGPRPDGPRPDGPDRGAQDGRGGPEGRGPEGGDARRFRDQILRFDENEDGKITNDELPQRMQGILERHDTNKDGVLDKRELEQIGRKRGGEFSRGPRDGEDGPRGRGPGPDGPGPGGPPSPERIVEHAMSFDADKDGKLSKAELMKFAQEVSRRRGPPGRGPDGGNGPGGRGKGDDQRSRQRPDSE